MTTIIQRARQRAAQGSQEPGKKAAAPKSPQLPNSQEVETVSRVPSASVRTSAAAGLRRAFARGFDKSWGRYGMVAGLVLLLVQGIGLAYLAVVMKRSTDMMLSQQIIMADRLVTAQTSVLHLTQGQESITRRVSVLTDSQASLQTQVASHEEALTTVAKQYASLRQRVNSEQQNFAKRLDTVEDDVQTVQVLGREVEDLLASAEKTWSRVALDLIAYRKGLEQLAQRVNQQDGTLGPQGQLRQSAMYITSPGMTPVRVE